LAQSVTDIVPFDAACSRLSTVAATLKSESRWSAVNADTESLIAGILTRAGAAIKCPRGDDRLILANDEVAEMSAVTIAVHYWLTNEPGFWGMKREEVIATVKRAMIGVPASCAECERGRSGDCQNRAVFVSGPSPQPTAPDRSR
jgi:hypothetical protein